MSKQQKKAKNIIQKPIAQSKPSTGVSTAINPSILIGVLALLTFVAYVGAFKNGFVEWDDQHYVTNNLQVLNPTAANLKILLTRIVALNYHPITMLSLAMNVILFGKELLHLLLPMLLFTLLILF